MFGLPPNAGRATPTWIMNKLQTPKHKATRSFLRVAGPAIAAVGLIFLIIGLVNFFSAFNGGGAPRLFWCFFVAIPLLFVGGVMCQFGFMGAIARYAAAEQVPVATDAANDLAEGTQDAVTQRLLLLGLREPQHENRQHHRVVRAEQPFEEDQQADGDEVGELDVHGE